MTDEILLERVRVGRSAKDVAVREKDAGSVALGQLTSWDFFEWTVVAVLALNLLVMILFFGGINSGLTEVGEMGPLPIRARLTCAPRSASRWPTSRPPSPRPSPT